MLAKATKETPSLGDVIFHIVGLLVCAVLVLWKNPMRFAGFWRVTVQFCGFRTPLMPPSFSATVKSFSNESYVILLINLSSVPRD